jgi:drug/metabolite transporter (DMT)-like permease
VCGNDEGWQREFGDGCETLMWVALCTAAAFGNALWTALSKSVVQQTPPLRMMLLFRIVQSGIFLAPFIVIRGLPTTAGFWLLIAAIGVLQAGRWVIILRGVKRDYFSAYGMYNTAPLFVLLLAPTTLPERFGSVVWIGVVLIVVGGILFYHTSRVSVYGLAGAIMTAVDNILSKHVVNQVSPLVFLFLMSVSSAVILAIAYPFVHRPRPAPARWWDEVRHIAPLAIISAAAGVFFFHALWLDTATRATAVLRTNLIFGFLLSYLMLKEKADWQYKLSGTALILVGTVSVAW